MWPVWQQSTVAVAGRRRGHGSRLRQSTRSRRPWELRGPSRFSPLPGRLTICHENCSLNVCHVLGFILFPLAVPTDHCLSGTDFFVARQVFYPIQFCVYSDTSLVTWFDWLFHDTAYLESVLLGMSAMDDFFRRTPPSKLTYSHMKATITALNNRLSDSSLCLADSTIAVVMGLAELAGILSDDTAAKAHVSGFQKMVRLRGGVGAFADNTKLQIKIGRWVICPTPPPLWP